MTIETESIDYEELAKVLVYEYVKRLRPVALHETEPLSVILTSFFPVLDDWDLTVSTVHDPWGIEVSLVPPEAQERECKVANLTTELGQVLTTLEPPEIKLLAESFVKLLEEKK